uniref:Uncharacterized protein n=1 Tax=Trichogramma kaykai TaxID=54128 RepID=A0ABD2XH64_9HYME
MQVESDVEVSPFRLYTYARPVRATTTTTTTIAPRATARYFGACHARVQDRFLHARCQFTCCRRRIKARRNEPRVSMRHYLRSSSPLYIPRARRNPIRYHISRVYPHWRTIRRTSSSSRRATLEKNRALKAIV